MENKREILKVVDLQKKFHKLEVLKGISTTFHENEVVSIIGPSGGGKSTFLRCLNLLEQPARSSLTARTSAPSRARPSTTAVSGWAWYSSSSTCSTTWT